ncbi:hypothetical protein EXIGUO8H_230004 [Exiguobacterium sp. 8H]|nr:hypothetical protein EXIGUO8H_230004 [Exiguobacterium sp. 8H]VXB97250.1 hypothetical protein EXIGUO8A_390003 [Exiguobacterium sp. 8A]
MIWECCYAYWYDSDEHIERNNLDVVTEFTAKSERWKFSREIQTHNSARRPHLFNID